MNPKFQVFEEWILGGEDASLTIRGCDFGYGNYTKVKAFRRYSMRHKISVRVRHLHFGNTVIARWPYLHIWSRE